MSTEQKPIGSGYGATTATEDVIAGIDLAGKVAIVTGGYSGLGLETVRTLAGAGATVVVPARTVEKARAALASVPGVELETLDLLDPGSIDAFADRFLASGRPLHILVNNAGIMASGFARDSRGYEEQFATNHLGHFQLTVRLWPALRKAQGARVVSVSSRGHQLGGVDFDDPNYLHRDYEKWAAYGQAKTANVLFAVALDEKGRDQGIRAFSLHPGSILTDLARHLSRDEIAAFGLYEEDGSARIDPDRDMKTVPQGAATSVWCATSPQLDGLGGVYCENCDIAPIVPESGLFMPGVRPWAIDRSLADRLWALSETLTGCKLPTG